MDAGDLRHRVVIQKRRQVQDALGGVNRDEIWDDVVTLWAAIAPVSGREYFDAERVNSEVSHTVTIRYQHGDRYGTENRVSHEDRIFQIVSSINVKERNEWVEMKCLELFSA